MTAFTIRQSAVMTVGTVWTFGDNTQIVLFIHQAGWVGDDYCDVDHNTAECNYDNGDCATYNNFIARHPDCQITNVQEITSKVSNSFCNAEFNTPECGFDGGDCTVLKHKYPNCAVPTPM